MPIKRRPWLELRGTLTGTPWETALPPGKYVYQRTARGHGNITDDRARQQQVRRHVIPANPNTALQIPQRLRFAQGVAAWHALTEPEREAYRAPGRARGLNRFQQFMSEYIPAHELPGSSVWDGGTSIWDGGTSIWDLVITSTWDGGTSIWDGGSTIWQDI
jgi:hypothetical protein